GVEAAPRMKKWKAVAEPTWGLQVLAKVEHLDFNISGLAANDPAGGTYAVDAFEVGLNAWATKHVRLTLNYVANFIGGFDGGKPTDAANLTSNIFYHGIDHELLLRIGVNL